MSLPTNTIASRDMVLPQASTLSDTGFLGYGYDVTGLYCHPSGVRAHVIDMHRFLENEVDAGRYERKVGSSSDTKAVTAENAMKYCTKLTANLGVDVKYKKLFSGSLSLKFDYKNSCSSKYSFASYFSIMRKVSVALIADASDLQPYLSVQFLKDIKSKPCSTLIRLYGTHLMTHIVLGGRLEVLCRSIIENTEKEKSVEAGIKASYNKIVTADLKVAYDESLVKNNKELQVNIETIGGDPFKCMNVSFDYAKANIDLKSDFSAWRDSLDDTNMTLVDMEKGSLIPIVDLIPDDSEYKSKKEEFSKAVDKYLSDNEFNLVDHPKPFYRYFCPTMDDHFYTMNWDELKYGNGNYSFERIECRMYDLKVEGSVPLYRYYSESNKDHIYTTNWNELQNGKIGYVFEGICGYVFASNQTDKNLVPLYRCLFVHDKKMDHFYTLDKSEFANGNPPYTDEGIACYVYKPIE